MFTKKSAPPAKKAAPKAAPKKSAPKAQPVTQGQRTGPGYMGC